MFYVRRLRREPSRTDINVISLFIPYGELIFGYFYFLLIYIPVRLSSRRSLREIINCKQNRIIFNPRFALLYNYKSKEICEDL